MKKFFPVIIFMAFTVPSIAQLVQDSAELTPGYHNEVFYQLSTKTKTSVPYTNFDMGFKTTLMSASIIADPNSIQVYRLPNVDTSNFTQNNLDTTGAIALFNSETSWQHGAFNATANPGDPFDFGWGEYSMVTHDVTGDSLYLVTQNALTYWRVWIKKKTSTGHYILRMRLLDNTNDITVDIDAPTYSSKNFIYYVLGAATPVDIEPASSDWDILFNRYYTYIPQLYGYYPVVGVYSNEGVKVAQADSVDLSTVSYTDYLGNFDSTLTDIGYDWKYFSQITFQYYMVDSLIYFIKTRIGDIYSIRFTGFSVTTGTANFETELLFDANAGVDAVTNPLKDVLIYPNPSSENVNLVYTANKSEEMNASVFDVAGRNIFNSNFTTREGFNQHQLQLPELPNGVYLLKLASGNSETNLKLVISK